MKKTYLILTAIIMFVALFSFETLFEDEIKSWFMQPSSTIVTKEVTQINKTEKTEVKDVVSADLGEHYIGMTTDQVIAKFGEPVRKDLSSYGYTWWSYSEVHGPFMQIGIKGDTVVTVFISNDEQEQSFENLNQLYSFTDRVEVKTAESVYEFELTSEDLRLRPLIKDGNGWVQFYFDQFTGNLSSKRMMTEEVLLLQRPYSLSYRGSLPAKPDHTPEQALEIEKGEAQQVFELTNTIRLRHGLSSLKWDEKVASVAFLHSEEMSTQNYFSHQSPIAGELGDRLKKGSIAFKVAGENIAAKYVDGVAAVEGWLNSEGHRVNLLSDEFTHLGVGVYENYYTQNFMTPWQN